MHPNIHGNKWFKLKHNIAYILQQGISRVLSFGGAYSNHIRALAALGEQLGIETIGVIRGERVEPLNPVLEFAERCGMGLTFVDRAAYRRKAELAMLDSLRQRFGEFYLLPEGGSNALGVQGCEELAQILAAPPLNPDFVMLPCGTGATIAGLIRGLTKLENRQISVLGVSVLKAPGYLHGEVAGWLRGIGGTPQWQVLEDFHCGGFGRTNPELSSFLSAFETYADIPLEPVYSGKLFHALFQLVEAGRFPSGSEILALHTGGLPGEARPSSDM
jgi:1-aminocyclopropane-1-carboxylate deaminase